VGFQQACHSHCLSWGRDLCESCFSSSLLGLSADGDPHPRWPSHQNKGDRGSWFSDKHHSLSLLSEGQGARRFISRGSPPLSPSTGPPPHPTGAAKSKCQSRRRRCIPPRGQLVVATEGSVVFLRRRLFKNLLFKVFKSSYRCISLLLCFKSPCMMTPSSRCSPCFEDNCPAYLPHSAQCSLLSYMTLSLIHDVPHINLLLSQAGEGLPVAARGAAAPAPSVQVIPAPSPPGPREHRV